MIFQVEPFLEITKKGKKNKIGKKANLESRVQLDGNVPI